MIKTKKQMFLIIASFVLAILLGTTTYAFFNYTRTGTANIIKTGRIYFNSEQGTSINLENLFPIDPTETGTMNDATKVGTVTLNVVGDTTYTGGIEYLISAVNVTNTVGNKSLPISIDVSYSANGNGKEIGTEDEEYFDNRGENTSIYKVLANNTIGNNKELVVGYIARGATGIDGNIVIKAYIDKEKVAISDTYPEEDVDTNNDEVIDYTNGTPSSFGDDRVVFTTSEWNSLQSNGVSFQIKVEANEGIWVEEIRSVNAMINLYSSGNGIEEQSDSIKEIYFNKMSAAEMQQAYDSATIKADLTANNEGRVLAWLEENQFDNTKYNLIVASNGDTYLTDVDNMFAYWKADKITFNNINTSRLTSMFDMFYEMTNLKEIDISSFDTSNVINMYALFSNNTSLETVKMSNLDLRNAENLKALFKGDVKLSTLMIDNIKVRDVIDMSEMFYNCSSLTSVDLHGLGGNSLEEIWQIFRGCSELREINMGGFDFGTASMQALFYDLDKLVNINLQGINTTNVTNISELFKECDSLTSIDLSNIDCKNVTTAGDIFYGADNLKEVNMSGVDFKKVTTINFFKNNQSIEIVNISNSKFDNFASMFSGCTNLKSVDMSGIEAYSSSTGKVYNMFNGCSSLETIYVSSTWDVSNQSQGMPIFSGCTSLVGGAGTTYDSSHVDKTYAIVDGGPSNPGYLTLKTN